MQKYLLKDYIVLLAGRGLLVEAQGVEALADREVALLSYNSADVVQDTLFVAKGAAFRAKYLRDAVDRGAFAYVADRELLDRLAAGTADVIQAIARDDHPVDAPCIVVTDIRLALSCLAAFYFGEPARDLTVVGIGGTKGKSTTTFFLEHILAAYNATVGRPSPAYLSTLETYDGVSRAVSHITTPESYEIHRHFRNAVDSGIREVIMEVSSQAFKVKRVPDVRFDIGIFTNISEDHISPIEHPDFDDYFRCKMEMFAQTETALVNCGMDLAEDVLAIARRDSGRILTYGVNADSVAGSLGSDADSPSTATGSSIAAGASAVPTEKPDYYAFDVRKDGFATRFRVHLPDADVPAGTVRTLPATEPEFVLNMPGLFNVENAVAAIAAAHLLGVPVLVIQHALRTACVPGRMELFHTADERIIAVVDYAHNKLSFEKLFESVREEFPGKPVFVVFGATGGKGVNRRHDLGYAAGLLADYAVVTSDDPGPEPFADIAAGIVKAFGQGFAERQTAQIAGATGITTASPADATGTEAAADHYAVTEDRRTAIQAAFAAAKLLGGAVILATGRGHEKTIKIGTEYLPYPSDVECISECIAQYNADTAR